MDIKLISSEELKSMAAQDRACIIDVREPAEYRSIHLKNSISLPLSKVSNESLPKGYSKIILVCLTGVRSKEASKKISSESIEIFSLDGGISSWKQSGFEVIESESKVLPLDRQTQIAAGSLALCGTLLGAVINPGFYIIPGFVGCGLIFAGLSGWCGMAKLLAKMPWNN